jgi:hypothetical protein
MIRDEDFKIKMSNHEVGNLHKTIVEGISRLEREDLSDTTKMLVMFMVKQLSVKLAKKLCEDRKEYKIKVTMPETLAIVSAFLEGHIYADPSDIWSTDLLQKIYKFWHQKT